MGSKGEERGGRKGGEGSWVGEEKEGEVEEEENREGGNEVVDRIGRGIDREKGKGKEVNIWEKYRIRDRKIKK